MEFKIGDKVKIKKTFEELYMSNSTLISMLDTHKGHEGTIVRKVGAIYYDILWDDGYVTTIINYALELCENKEYESVW